jgi:uncharacterized protein (UPF0276 family)
MSRTAGLGFKSEFFDEAFACRTPGLWYEVHAENYMTDGGPRIAMLEALRERHPVALHGVGLSLVSPRPPEPDHLKRLARLIERIRPAAVSDHLAWRRWRGIHFQDFLPFPRTRQALDHAADNVARVQDAIGRRLLVENPSLYVDLAGHQLGEADFLAQLAERTGCGLLVDVNNAFVSAVNLGLGFGAYLDALPGAAIEEIHLAGHSCDAQSPLLIDSHDAPVSKAVWRGFERLVARIGARPTLIERDDRLPPFAVLIEERGRAHVVLAACGAEPVNVA